MQVDDNFYNLLLVHLFLRCLEWIEAKAIHCFDDVGEMWLLCIKISVWFNLEKERILPSRAFYWQPLKKNKNKNIIQYHNNQYFLVAFVLALKWWVFFIHSYNSCKQSKETKWLIVQVMIIWIINLKNLEILINILDCITVIWQNIIVGCIKFQRAVCKIFSVYSLFGSKS